MLKTTSKPKEELVSKQPLGHIPEVLIVDDDPNVADVLQQLLEDEGFAVNYEDMKMPRLGGVELLHEIVSRWNGDIDVSLMRASETPVGLGVPFLQKPFDLDDVIFTIVNYPEHS